MQARLNRTLRIGWKIAALVGAALLISSPALAGQPQGIAQIEVVHMGAHSVVLSGETYSVTPSTHIVDAKGRQVKLADLRAKPAGAVLVSDEDVDVVAWTATQSRSGWLLTELRILEEMPD